MVLFGGRSSEHQISCATAGGVMRAIDRDRWDVVPVGITPEGQWVRQPDDPSRYEIRDGAGYTVTANDRPVALVTGTNLLVDFTVGADGNLDADGGEAPTKIDVVLPLLHGAYGEDGTLQGLLELSKLPYVGCGVASSAVSMDKALTKAVLNQGGIPVGNWVSVSPRRWAEDREAVLTEITALGLPIFVKPCRAGSSQGVQRVTSAEEIIPAIEAAQEHDPRVIVEAELAGREVECGVLQRADGSLVVSPIGEIAVESVEFYDYETKYFDQGAVTLTCPADLPATVTERLQAAALSAFEVLECEGLARVDFFYDPETDAITLNEVNTLPGFTPFSMYPTMLSAAGVTYGELVEELLLEALVRPSGLR